MHFMFSSHIFYSIGKAKGSHYFISPYFLWWAFSMGKLCKYRFFSLWNFVLVLFSLEPSPKSKLRAKNSVVLPHSEIVLIMTASFPFLPS